MGRLSRGGGYKFGERVLYLVLPRSAARHGPRPQTPAGARSLAGAPSGHGSSRRCCEPLRGARGARRG
eukprot:2897423-Alexandrium_andersonii.AAC.1